MKTLRIIIATIGIAAPVMATAQSGGSAIGAGLLLCPLQSESFQTFFRSYNEVNAAHIETAFKDDWPMLSGLGVNARVYFCSGDDNGFVFGADLAYIPVRTRNEAIMANGDTRKMNFKASYIPVGMDLGFKAGPLHMAALVSMVYLPTYLYVGMEYGDGTMSYGTEHWLNGVYWSNRVGWSGGGLIALDLGDFLQLNVTAHYLFPPGNGEMALAPSRFSDQNAYRVVHDLPRDLVAFAALPNTADNFIRHDLAGLMINVSLNFSSKP